jgi:hypothetical protein
VLPRVGSLILTRIYYEMQKASALQSDPEAALPVRAVPSDVPCEAQGEAMTDGTRLPVSRPESYIMHSRLADAKVPMGASVTHIQFAWRWRRVDERMGDGYSRR